MKKVLGLDLRTNSIGWAIVDKDENDKLTEIRNAGCRIIPMDAAELGDFDKGNSRSPTSERTRLRGVRRLRERYLLRRERLLRVLHIMGFLPEHFEKKIGWDRNNYRTFGKLPSSENEVKLPWVKTGENRMCFLFQDSFNEMLDDFAKNQPELVAEGKKVPYDWTIYYLRKKALTHRISKEELAWILLNFNQKRGYNQLRDEEDSNENTNKKIEFYTLKVLQVVETKEKKGKDSWYNVFLENGWIYRRVSSIPLDWEGKTKEFIVTTDVDDSGKPLVDEEGNVKRSFRAPKEDDWFLVKKRTESKISEANKTVGAYIYDSLLNSPDQKIIGGLVRTVERNFYKEELRTILSKQTEFMDELQDTSLLEACVKDLYSNNDVHRKNLLSRNFTALFIDDILFYQRPLKRKASLISDCPYESRSFVDTNTGEVINKPTKCIAKSNPLFQEFRLWQFVSNLKVFQKQKYVETPRMLNYYSSSIIMSNRLETDVDITSEFLKSEEDYVGLFKWMNNRKEVDQKSLLKYFKLKIKDIPNFRWNYAEDKTYPCNQTRSTILAKLNKEEKDKLCSELEMKIWHLLYSVKTKEEIDAALKEPKDGRVNLYKELRTVFSVESIEKLKTAKLIEGGHAQYSAKAIRKLLPLMRMGEYWTADTIDSVTKDRIATLLSGGWSKDTTRRAKERISKLKDISDFRNLPLWLACYIVYNRQSEGEDITKWDKPEDIDAYLKSFRRHSLRNPVVESLVLETLRVVRDIWRNEGRIDEIHLELGREMRNPSEKRKQISQQILENEYINLRIKRLLNEFAHSEFGVENVRPYSPSQQELLRIYEDGVLSSIEHIPNDIELIIRKLRDSESSRQISRAEILKYKSWLNNKYRSPYTGEHIPLDSLFTKDYEIEHIIPQSRYFDDSLSNKVICEREVNRLKGNLLGLEFIKNNGTEKVLLANGKTVEIFSVDKYQAFINEYYSSARSKMKKLLMDEIPDSFIEHYLSDSRYVSKLIKGLLSNIVREQGDDGDYELDTVSKNLITCSESISNRLKKEWEMNNVWNNIVYPRFERLNELMGCEKFGHWEEKKGVAVFQTKVPMEYQKGFNKKRIDYRHNALEAIVVACATKDHISYLGNEAVTSKNNKRYQLAYKLRTFEKVEILSPKGKKEIREIPKAFVKPSDNFTENVQKIVENTVVCFKQNLRIINKASNRYEHFDVRNGVSKKVIERQDGHNSSIRKPMHKDTVFGRVNLRRIREVKLSVAIDYVDNIIDKQLRSKIKELLTRGFNAKKIKKHFVENSFSWPDLSLDKVKISYYTDDTNEPVVATRKTLDTSFNEKKIIGSVTDTGIQKILLKHLMNHANNPDAAFSADGIDEMNRDITHINNGKQHKPIQKLRVSEPLGNKFCVGSRGNKVTKYVEVAKGTNLFFAIYEKEVVDKETNSVKIGRAYESIPLHVVVNRQKKGLPSISEFNEVGNRLLFSLSPYDLVYVPTPEEIEQEKLNEPINKDRIYKMVSCTSSMCFFVKNSIATPIVDKFEFSPLNKMERSLDRLMIKEVCIPIKVNRLGQVKLIDE